MPSFLYKCTFALTRKHNKKSFDLRKKVVRIFMVKNDDLNNSDFLLRLAATCRKFYPTSSYKSR